MASIPSEIIAQIHDNFHVMKTTDLSIYELNSSLIELYKYILKNYKFLFDYIPDIHLTPHIVGHALNIDKNLGKKINLTSEDFCIELLHEQLQYRNELQNENYVGEYPICECGDYDDYCDNGKKLQKWNKRHQNWLYYQPDNVFEFITNKTEKITQTAIKLFPHNIKYITHQTEDLCILAIKSGLRNYSLIKYYTDNIRFELIKKTPNYIRYITKPTDEMKACAITCGLRDGLINSMGNSTPVRKALITKNINSIKHMKKVDEELYIHAIQLGYSNYGGIHKVTPNITFSIFKYLYPIITCIGDVTDEMYVDILRKKNVSKFVNNTSDIVILELIKYNINYILNVEKPSQQLLLNAVNINPHVIQLLNNPSRDICLVAVKKDGMMLEYIKNFDEEMCMEAIKNNCKSVKFINNNSTTNVENIFMYVVNKNGLMLKYIDTKNINIINAAVFQNGYAIKYVNRQTYEICKLAVNNSIFTDEIGQKYKLQDRIKCLKSSVMRKKILEN